MQIVELHYRRRPHCDYDAIRARVQVILQGEPDSLDTRTAGKAFIVFHKRYVVEYPDGRFPAQTAILAADKPAPLETYKKETRQSWCCSNAEEILRGSSQSQLVTEMAVRGLRPQDRMSLFHGVLQATIEITSPDALVFTHSQQVVAPAVYLASCSEDPIFRPGSMNVRFFRIPNSDGDMVMDTRGLDEIDVPDVQCHFRYLEPNEIWRVLFNTAACLYRNGPVIESGQTVKGVHLGSMWRCQFEKSLLEPAREVLDLPVAHGADRHQSDDLQLRQQRQPHTEERLRWYHQLRLGREEPVDAGGAAGRS